MSEQTNPAAQVLSTPKAGGNGDALATTMAGSDAPAMSLPSARQTLKEAGGIAVPDLPTNPAPPPPSISIKITSPKDGDAVVGKVSGVPISVMGTFAGTSIDPGSVDVKVTVGGAPQEANVKEGLGDSGTWSYSGITQAPGEMDIVATITADGIDPGAHLANLPKVKNQDSVHVKVDSTPPGLQIISPTGDVVVTGKPGIGYLLPVNGTASWARFAVASLVWQGDWDPTTSQSVSTADGFAHWNAQIQVPPGIHTITFTCTNIGGFSSTVTLQVRVELPSDIFGTDPQQYLQALIEFAAEPAIGNKPQIARVQISGKDATEADLRGTFGQPFGDLTLAKYNRRANEVVHKIRLCIEVLRKRLGAQGSATPADYILQAYQTLLVQVGTSYDEVKLSRTYSDQDRLALAGRLGISPDKLSSLLFDPDAAAGDSKALTEAALEMLFGLVDTTRDPLSDGQATSSPPVGVAVPRWSLEGVDWGRTTDLDGQSYLKVAYNVGGAASLNIYSDSQQGDWVATASPAASIPTGGDIPIIQQNDSGLSGLIRIAPLSSSLNQATALSVFPKFLAWQMSRLRETWAAEDFPPVLQQVNPSTAQQGQKSVSLTITGQFTHFVQGTTTADFGPGITVVSVTVNSPTSATAIVNIDAAAAPGARDVTVRTGFEAVTLAQAFVVTAGVPMLTQVSPNAGAPGQQNVSVTLTANSTHFVQGTTTADFGPGIAVTSLTVNSPTSGTAVVKIDWGAPAGPHEVKVTTGTEVVSLSAGFGVTELALNAVPIIDPDLLFPSDFKHPLASDPAYGQIYLPRQQSVQNWHDNLKQLREVQGLDAILESVLGKTSSDLTGLESQRNQGTDISRQLAAMNLSPAPFDKLLHIIALNSAPAPSVLKSEWEEVYNILVQVKKLNAFPSWRTEEQAQKLGHNLGQTLTVDPIWFQITPSTDVDPPQNSPSRATPTAREAWLSKLQGRINQQQDLVQGLRAAVDATEAATLPTLRDALLEAMVISMPIPGLYSTGTDTATVEGKLIDRHWALVANPAGPLPVPQPACSTINRPPTWLANSASSGWMSPQADESSGDPPGAYTYRTKLDLTGLDPSSAQVSVKVAVDDALTAVQVNGQSLPGATAGGFQAFTAVNLKNPFAQGGNPYSLDFLVNNAGSVANPTGLRLEFSSSINVVDKSNRLTECFLMDFACAGYQTTTRLIQAIDTLQDLFFSLRTARFQGFPPLAAWQLSEDPASFDTEWNWMGTYATWVAAMRVSLYPENLLLPRLCPPPDSTQPNVPSSPAFSTLISNLADKDPLSPADARNEAITYWNGPHGTDGMYALLKGRPNASPALDQINTLLNPPDKKGVPRAVVDLIDADLLTLASLESQAFAPYSGADTDSATSRNYLREAFFCVPIYIAAQLQQAGQFVAALDWLRTVYAYNLPIAQRKIYYWLIFEESIQTEYEQTPQWLLDSLNPHVIVAKTRANAYAQFTLLSLVRLMLDAADREYAKDSLESLSEARTLYLTALDLLNAPELHPPTDARVIPNPIPMALRAHAELALMKLRTSRDVAGLVRPADGMLSPIGGSGSITPPTPGTQPTAYRYEALMDRAKQLVSLAGQMESTFLATVEKANNEEYSDLKAKQDLDSAGANVDLQNLQLNQANDNLTLADDQRQRVQIQVNHYSDLLNSDIGTLEELSLAAMGTQIYLQGAAGVLYGSAAIQAGISPIGLLTFGATSVENTGAALTSFASAAGAVASMLSAQASYEEKQKDWQFQLDLSNQDTVIAGQQYKISQDQQSVAMQQLAIAQKQHDHAQAVLDFLTTQKFTNAILYEWMAGVLQRVYSYFLQQAAAVARMAQNQLAFERQETTPNFIQADYWKTPSDGSSASQPSDTKGLTGSARLLQDVTRLNEYAFETDKRKLQLTKMISLAQLDPFAFQQFQQTGVLRFNTSQDLFDRDFPGQYLRLIKRVRVSVIALIPPTLGVHATLANPGVSRVVVEDDTGDFQSAIVRREPQLIALSSPANSTGLFDLVDSQPNLLLPFENLGVDTNWEFVMPRASNPFDYSTIADVLMTIDYTALDSPDHRKQVIQQMDRSITADRAYSFRQQFADAWYDLNNPDQSPPPMVVQFETKREDFPANIGDDSLTIAQVLLYFVPRDGAAFTISVKSLQFTPDGSQSPLGGAAGPTVSVLSTRRGNAASWIPMIGQTPIGQWELALPDDAKSPTDPQSPRNLIRNGQITDILMVITYSGQTPSWPT